MTALTAPTADGPPPSAAASSARTEPDGSVGVARGAMSTVVLSSAGEAVKASDSIRPRRIAGQLAAAAVVVVVLVGVIGSSISQQVAQRQAVHDVAELTDVLAQSAVAPALTDAMANDPAAARAVLDPLVRRDVLSADLVRVKLWTPAGRIALLRRARVDRQDVRTRWRGALSVDRAADGCVGERSQSAGKSVRAQSGQAAGGLPTGLDTGRAPAAVRDVLPLRHGERAQSWPVAGIRRHHREQPGGAVATARPRSSGRCLRGPVGLRSSGRR